MLLVGYTAADLFAHGKHGKSFTDPALLGADVTCHCLDIYHRHAIEKAHHLKAICSAHLPEGPWDVIRFKTGPKRMSGELALDLLQEISRLLGGDLKPPRFEFVYEGKERDRNALLAKITDDPTRVRDFSSQWQASVPGHAPLTFTSFPGCFCHRRLDPGGLALAEVAVADLRANTDVVAADLRAAITHGESSESRALSLLDMGCGCGLVGLLIADALKATSLTLVDSHSRAIEAATLNAERLRSQLSTIHYPLSTEIILSDNGTPARLDGTFDVFVGNPPYYSDYRIADVFLETAKRALRPSGVCYTVCKNAAGLEPVQARYFPQVEIIKRRGYAVLKSINE